MNNKMERDALLGVCTGVRGGGHNSSFGLRARQEEPKFP